MRRFVTMVLPVVAPAGSEAALPTMRHRRRNQLVAGGVLTLALLAGTAAAYAVTNNRHPGQQASGRPTATTQAPEPTPSDSSVPSAAADAPDGRIGFAELNKATLQVPAWPNGMLGHCPHGAVKMDTKDGVDYTRLRILGQPIYVDVDHDGALETLINLTCSPQGSAQQVLAYDRDTAGRIQLVGKVVGTVGPRGRQGVDIMQVHRIAAAPEGRVNVDVGEYFTCCGDNPDSSQHQWRTYGWDGTRFVHAGGPTAFGPNPKVTDLAVAASDLIMAKQADGKWHGTLTVTVVNRGDYEAPGVLLVALPTEPTPSGIGWSGCDVANDGFSSCKLGVLAAGTSRTVRLGFLATDDPAGEGHVSVHSETEKGSYPDSNADDNRVRVHIRV
ncbi:MAG TPA: hypothetical protein VGJ53_01105 [Micromonosporaceae bacterium]